MKWLPWLLSKLFSTMTLAAAISLKSDVVACQVLSANELNDMSVRLMPDSEEEHAQLH